jgi:hypothetical protein
MMMKKFASAGQMWSAALTQIVISEANVNHQNETRTMNKVSHDILKAGSHETGYNYFSGGTMEN